MNSLTTSDFDIIATSSIAGLIECGCKDGGTHQAFMQYKEERGTEVNKWAYYGCDIDPERVKHARKLGASVVLAESMVFLASMEYQFKGYRYAFYLDSHYSGGAEKDMLDVECPLLDEIDFIVSKAYSPILIIDDIRVFAQAEAGGSVSQFGLTPEAWPSLTAILQVIVKKASIKWIQANNDRWFIWVEKR